MLSTPLTPELICSDIKASLAFYVGILGFKIQYQRDEDGFAMLERQSSRLMLDQFAGKNTRLLAPAPFEKPYGRGINLQIETRNVDDLYLRVQASKVVLFLPLEERWYRADRKELGNRQFVVLDPDGYMLRFFQDLGSRTARS
jgi:catechol 2,3-dioxygenase-like lactoylglutathione lyase family enzyme